MTTEEQRPAADRGSGGERVEPRTKRQVAGTVVARWTGTSKALIELETGTVVEAEGAEQLANAFRVGAAVNVYFDEHDTVLGWMLTDVNTGVNLERSENA